MGEMELQAGIVGEMELQAGIVGEMELRLVSWVRWNSGWYRG